MNDYEAKQERRRQRYLDRADDAAAESDRRYKACRTISDGIPMGQPILVGHHSERHHRADLKRMDNHMRAASEESKKADHYRHKADAVGSGGVSSDDPEAVQKLQEQLDGAEQLQAAMKAANGIIRKAPKYQRTDEKLAALVALGLTPEVAAKAFDPDFCGRIGYPDYQLTNNGANIRRLRQRIEQLRAAQDHTPVCQQHGAIEYREEDNRVRLVFPGKPSDGIRASLKAHGFRWSPTAGAWQRHLNNAGRFAAKLILESLKA